LEQLPKLRSQKNPGEIGGEDTGSKAHLEVRVEIGEANGGGVLDGAVGLAPALHRRHFLGGPLRPPRRCSPLLSWPSGSGDANAYGSGFFYLGVNAVIKDSNYGSV
jgi:hypothetical protein